MSSLSLKNICKVYPNGFEAVKDFNLEIKATTTKRDTKTLGANTRNHLSHATSG